MLSGILLNAAIISVCLVNDLRTRKINNKLLLALLPLALLGAFFIKNHPIEQILFSALLALLITLPLYMAKALGGGDLKFFFVFSLCLLWHEVWRVFIYALPWAVLLGLLKLFLDKKSKEFLFNIISILKFKKVKKTSLHTIPFSVALLFGWLTLLVLQGVY